MTQIDQIVIVKNYLIAQTKNPASDSEKGIEEIAWYGAN